LKDLHMDSARIQPLQEWQIEQGVTLSFNGREVGALTSQLGTIWITQPGIMCDYFLHAGERFEVAPNAGHIVVEAVSAHARVASTVRSASLAPVPTLQLRETLARALHRFANWIDAPRSRISTC
jgi:Protein of unknown function (DUF2917)